MQAFWIKMETGLHILDNMDESLYSRQSNLVIGFHGCDQLEESIRIILIHNIKGVSFLPNTSGKRGYIFFFLFTSPSNIFPKFLASFRRKAYLCRSKAALGNLKASFHSVCRHNLCRTKVELLK